MPSKSKAQQKFMGMVRAYQKGELENPSDAVKKAAASMDKDDVEDYASTKHKGLPNKKEVIDKIREFIRKEIHGLIEAKDKAKKTFKFKFKCVECGKIFMKKLTPKTFEVQCPKCHGFDVEPY